MRREGVPGNSGGRDFRDSDKASMNPLMRPVRGQGARRLCVWGAISALAATLAGCASAVTEMPDSPPGRTVSSFPAVHDVPPAREEKALTDAEQLKLQQDLTAAGQSLPAKVQEIEQADKPVQPAAKPAKPAPADTKRPPGRQAAGTRPNP